MFVNFIRSLFLITINNALLDLGLCSLKERQILKVLSDEKVLHTEIRNTHGYLVDKFLKRHTSDGQIRIKKATEVSEKESRTRFMDDSNCTLSVESETKVMFTERILNEQFNFVRLRLDGVNISAVGQTIMPDHWIWTYKGSNGGHQLLKLPIQTSYMSFGLAFSYAMPGVFNVKILPKGDCKTLNVGDERTNVQIGSVLAGLTKDLANKHSRYNNSYWCYTRKVPIEPYALFYACKNFVCPLQVTEHTCCRYSGDPGTNNRHIICGNDDYRFDAVWWAFPIFAGSICFAFYPLLLTFIGSKMQRKTESDYTSLDAENDQESDGYISVGVSYPVTVLSTIMDPVLCIVSHCETTCLRCLRVLIILIPVLLTTVHVTLRAVHTMKYQGGLFFKHCILRDFDSMLAGPATGKHCFLTILGGPFVAVPLYIIIGCFLILLPQTMGNFFVKGMFHPNRYVLAFRPTREVLETMTGISVSAYTCYKKLHWYTLAHSLLVLNYKFWKIVLLLFVKRWKNIRTSYEDGGILRKKVMLNLATPIYIMICFLELILTLLYLTFPVFRWFFIALKAYMIATRDFTSAKGYSSKRYTYPACLLVGLAFCFVWYMYCMFFVDGFWFITKVIMFTFTGIIAYPSVSYGYVTFVLTSLYYLVECINAYGSRYNDLLKISIDACAKFQSENSGRSNVEEETESQDTGKIETELFGVIIEAHMPKRVYMFITIFKFTLIIIVIGISMHLLICFDKMRDISLEIHIFTAIFVSSIPKLVQILCIKNRSKFARKKLQGQVYQTVCEYKRSLAM